MFDYFKLRAQLEVVNPDEWESILSEVINVESSIDDKFTGQRMGLFVTDIIVAENRIEAAVYCTVFGNSKYSEDGEYQDEDGDSYGHKELEYEFQLTISPNGTNWEKL